MTNRKKPHKAAQHSRLPLDSLAGARVVTVLVIPAILILTLFFLTFRPINDPDCWFHMAFGRYLLEHGRLPPGDVFSSTAAGREWISSGWLSSVFMQALFAAFGPSGAGLLLMVLFCLTSAVLSIYYLSLRSGSLTGAVALPLLAGMLASYLRYSPRPDVWSQMMAALVAVVVLGAERPLASASPRVPRRLWLLPLLFVLWANLHAGFLAGFLILAGFAAFLLHQYWRLRKREFLLSLIPVGLPLVAWWLNPYGFRIVALAGKIKDIPEVNLQIFEWMPLIWKPGFNLPWPAHAGLALLLVLSVLAAMGRQRPHWWRFAVAGAFLAFALYQRRQAGLAALVIPAMLAAGPSALDEWFARRRAVLLASVAGLGILISSAQVRGLLEAGSGWPVAARNCRALPCLVTDYLADNRPPALMFNSYGMGGYLLYFLSPETPVFIDGRLDVYDPQLWKDYLAIEEDRLPLDDAATTRGLNTFVIDIRDSYDLPVHLAYRLARHPGWRLVYFDDDAAVFVRDSPQTASYLAGRAYRHLSPWQPERFRAALANEATRREALEEMRRAREQSMDSANALAMAAMAAHYFGDTASEAAFLKQALARDPQSFLARKLAGAIP